MTTAADTYTWLLFEDTLKTHLGLTGDDTEDDNLELWLAAAAEDCDNFTGNTFTDDAGDPITHPSSIKLGIIEWVMAFRSWSDPDRNAGATEVSTGPLREKFQGGNAGTDARTLAHAAAAPHWYPSKIDISLMGAA